MERCAAISRTRFRDRSRKFRLIHAPLAIFPVTNIRGGIDSICTSVARAGSRNGVRERTVLNVGLGGGRGKRGDGIEAAMGLS